ncbi:MAG TPA: MgtC/SapB family protein [Flavobacteriaceae bacterium]|nr:MgtC/SapB family protein [Flavobacteriaceae bacterium]
MELHDFVLRIGAAAVAGVLIGIEREFKNKHAGLKTNTLVSLGATVFMITSLEFTGFKDADLTRVLSQIVVGVGFLGAGVIWKREGEIEGLTTAATIWCSAAVGCLASLAMYRELLIITALIIVINLLFGKIDNKIKEEVQDDWKEKKKE